MIWFGWCDVSVAQSVFLMLLGFVCVKFGGAIGHWLGNRFQWRRG